MGFSADWLALREPADHAARDARMLARAAQVAGPGGLAVDLGAGTGSTARAFALAGHGGLRWRLVDADAGLLAHAAAVGETRVHDLRDLDALPLDGAALVTCSALIDLVSAAWLHALVDRVVAAGLPFYAALSYDGAMDWTPALPQDGPVTDAFNHHQRGDKGFGPALGPAATAQAAARFAAAGYLTMQADSPWRLGPESVALQAALIDGIAAAAGGAGAATDTAAWAAARQARLDAGPDGGLARIGHRDLLALPPGAIGTEGG